MSEGAWRRERSHGSGGGRRWPTETAPRLLEILISRVLRVVAAHDGVCETGLTHTVKTASQGNAERDSLLPRDAVTTYDTGRIGKALHAQLSRD